MYSSTVPLGPPKPMFTLLKGFCKTLKNMRNANPKHEYAEIWEIINTNSLPKNYQNL